MNISDFIKRLRKYPTEITFQNTMDIIEAHYSFEPTSFINGNVTNETGQNSGSCKLFSFAKIHDLEVEETLNCFGEHYRNVLQNPEGTDHQNIRNFMKTGWSGISFKDQTLTKRLG
ncbi:type III effector [Aquimarina sp. AD1]|uniref:HopJ type III effector protein n=1 Tax=Aquimarina sp. (strain AD1) TaxID=1714848 RepID=UPI000E4A34EE|nr:HopJ type III effector protein [Aquimarina sp. AD1]AXT57132.1 type III effector [Aquimarina sp. AD1]RKN37139.1 type III effector [Aquimarina sp. AD1]